MRTLATPAHTAAVGLLVVIAACSQVAPPPAANVAPAPTPVVSQPVTPAAGSPPAPAPPATVAAAASVPSVAEPDLATMQLAQPPSKLGVPVDLRYQFDAAAPGQPVTLHLAAVPRVSGGNLKMSVKQVAGLRTTTASLGVQKVTANTGYRQQLSITRLADAPAELRVLVTMDLPEGSTFGWFSVPLASMAGRAN